MSMPQHQERPASVGCVLLFRSYRTLALVVGVLLLLGCAGSLLKYGHHLGIPGLDEGSALQQLGESLALIWVLHGWVYMVYVVVAFVLTQRAGWKLSSFLLMLVAGLVPLLIFSVERNVVARLRAENPQLAGSSA